MNDGWFQVSEERKIESTEYGIYAVFTKDKKLKKYNHIIYFRPGYLYRKISDPIKWPKR